MNFDIYFDDLTTEMQNYIMSELGIDSPEEMNWDIVPITSVYIENEEE